MTLLENLLILYAGVLCINILISAILWIHDREPLYRSVFFLWLTCIFSLTMQGIFSKNNLYIVLGFSSTFLINISLSHLLSQITGIKVPWKFFIVLLLLSYPAVIFLDSLQLSFTLVALPVVTAVSFPAIYTGLKALFHKWNKLTISARALSVTTCILALHNFDFAFLRMLESFAPVGFSIVIIIIFCLSIFAPAVVLEVLKEKQSILKELDRLKSNFFTNISHEFRTPLTLIRGPLSSLISIESDENKIRSLNIIKRNADRLLCLINQLLDFSRLESGKMKLQACKADIVSFVKGIMISFQSLAEQKMITVKFTSDEEKVNLYFDREKAEKIFVNLLSNAFKFTPEGGRVEIFLKHSLQHPLDNGRGCLQFIISNSGPGIPAEMLPHIFDRFYQADDSTTRTQEGTGIGLALSKELVELHHGIIQVKSIPNQETKFTVTLLLGRDHLTADQIVEDETFQTNQVSKTTENIFLADSKESDISVKSKLHTTVLIIEDNADMQTYIEEILNTNYKVKKAFDGQQGVEEAMQYMPDLIISDLMMPKKDGYQLCKELKSCQTTSHIPIILLTAKAEKQDKLTGLELGADDYLIKPFDSEELLVRVKNLITQRRLLREKFNKNITVEPRDITVSSVDETFMKKAFDLVEQNMDNSDFDTSLFAREIGMSRGHLNTKLKVLTGLSSRQFISSMRLKRAAQLLKQKHGNISEIAYEVGFNSLSHFSKIFKNTFGVLPSLYNIKV